MTAQKPWRCNCRLRRLVADVPDDVRTLAETAARKADDAKSLTDSEMDEWAERLAKGITETPTNGK